MSDEELNTVADFVGIPREQIRRFVGVIRVMGGDIISNNAKKAEKA